MHRLDPNNIASWREADRLRDHENEVEAAMEKIKQAVLALNAQLNALRLLDADKVTEGLELIFDDIYGDLETDAETNFFHKGDRVMAVQSVRLTLPDGIREELDLPCGAAVWDTCTGELLPQRFDSLDSADAFVEWIGQSPFALPEHVLRQRLDEWQVKCDARADAQGKAGAV